MPLGGNGKPFYFYYVYSVLCHFNTESGFIFSSHLIGCTEEESLSQFQAGIKRGEFPANSILTGTWSLVKGRGRNKYPTLQSGIQEGSPRQLLDLKRVRFRDSEGNGGKKTQIHRQGLQKEPCSPPWSGGMGRGHQEKAGGLLGGALQWAQPGGCSLGFGAARSSLQLNVISRRGGSREVQVVQ